MGGLMSRNKGKRAEREVVNMLQPVLDAAYRDAVNDVAPILQRNTLQSDRGGYDIVGLDWLALEVKHHETVTPSLVDKWWLQCSEQAHGKVGVLFYRKNGVPFRIRLRAGIALDESRVAIHSGVIDVDEETFLWVLYKMIVQRLEKATTR